LAASLSTCSKLDNDVDGLISEVRSTDDSVMVLCIRTGAMVLFVVVGMLSVVYANEEWSAAAGMLYGFMN
jgi:hypothetical protein